MAAPTPRSLPLDRAARGRVPPQRQGATANTQTEREGEDHARARLTRTHEQIRSLPSPVVGARPVVPSTTHPPEQQQAVRHARTRAAVVLRRSPNTLECDRHPSGQSEEMYRCCLHRRSVQAQIILVIGGRRRLSKSRGAMRLSLSLSPSARRSTPLRRIARSPVETTKIRTAESIKTDLALALREVLLARARELLLLRVGGLLAVVGRARHRGRDVVRDVDARLPSGGAPSPPRRDGNARSARSRGRARGRASGGIGTMVFSSARAVSHERKARAMASPMRPRRAREPRARCSATIRRRFSVAVRKRAEIP